MNLTESLVEALVLPWVQAWVDGDPTDPSLVLTGESLAPAGDSWQPGASVSVVDAGGDVAVAIRFDGVDMAHTIQRSHR